MYVLYCIHCTCVLFLSYLVYTIVVDDAIGIEYITTWRKKKKSIIRDFDIIVDKSKLFV